LTRRNLLKQTKPPQRNLVVESKGKILRVVKKRIYWGEVARMPDDRSNLQLDEKNQALQEKTGGGCETKKTLLEKIDHRIEIMS